MVKLVVREAKPEPEEEVLELWLEPHSDGIMLRSQTRGRDTDDFWNLLLFKANGGVEYCFGLPSELGLDLDERGHIKIT